MKLDALTGSRCTLSLNARESEPEKDQGLVGINPRRIYPHRILVYIRNMG